MTSHRTASKLLLTLLFAIIATGMVSGLEITEPSDGAANNTEFTFNVSVESGNYQNIGLETVGGTVIASAGELSGTGVYTWQDGDTNWAEGTYSIQAFNSSSNAASPSVDVIIDETADEVTDVTASANPDGSIELSITWQTNGDSSPAYFNITRLNEDTGNITYFKKTSIDSGWVDDQTEFTNYTYTVGVIDNAGNMPSDSKKSSTSVVEVKDGVSPTIQGETPSDGAYIGRSSVSLDVGLIDSLSGLRNATIILNDQNQTKLDLSGSEEDLLTLSIDGLEDGVHKPEVIAWDIEENYANYSWEFTVDTQRPSPSASLTPDPGEQEFITTETPIGVDVDSEDVGPKKVDRIECYVDNPSDYGYDFGASSTYEDGSFRCGDLNPADYSEGEHSIYVQFYDRAGNMREKNLGSYTFDTEPPQIESLEITPEYTNEEPNVTVEGSDSGSGLQDVEYMFSDNVKPGDGSDVSASFEDGQIVFEPNLRNKEDGEYTLFVRIQDGSGKWSNIASQEFTLDRGALPDPSLKTGVLNITSGDSTSFQIVVENNGKVPLMDASLHFSNGITGSRKGVSVTGESSKTYSLTVSTNESFGQTQATLELVSDTVSRNITVPVNVMASKNQQQQVDSQIQDYNARLSDLKSDISRLKEKGASEKLIEQMQSEIQKFEAKLESVKSATLNNNYYTIASELENVEKRKSQAVNTTEQVRKEFKSNQRQQMLLLIALISFVALGGAAVLYHRSEYYIDTEDIPVSVDSLSMDSFDRDEVIQKVEDKLDSILEGSGEEDVESDSDDSDGLSWN